MSVGVGVLCSIHFNSQGQLFSEVETEFSPQIIPAETDYTCCLSSHTYL